jgi:hypothetical protein
VGGEASRSLGLVNCSLVTLRHCYSVLRRQKSWLLLERFLCERLRNIDMHVCLESCWLYWTVVFWVFGVEIKIHLNRTPSKLQINNIFLVTNVIVSAVQANPTQLSSHLKYLWKSSRDPESVMLNYILLDWYFHFPFRLFVSLFLCLLLFHILIAFWWNACQSYLDQGRTLPPATILWNLYSSFQHTLFSCKYRSVSLVPVHRPSCIYCLPAFIIYFLLLPLQKRGIEFSLYLRFDGHMYDIYQW